MLRGKCIAINTYIKSERFQINILTSHLKNTEKEQTKNSARRKKLLNIRLKVTDNRKKIEKIKEINSSLRYLVVSEKLGESLIL